MRLRRLQAHLRVQSHKHPHMKCIQVGMEGVDAAEGVIVLKQFFHFENLHLECFTFPALPARPPRSLSVSCDHCFPWLPSFFFFFLKL